METKMLKKMRGAYTEEIKEKYGITKDELRLIPYVHYCIINNQRIDLDKISHQEVEILGKWEKAGLIIAGFDAPCAITSKEFWTKMCNVLYDAYATRYE